MRKERRKLADTVTNVQWMGLNCFRRKKKAFVCACDRDTACNYLYAVIVCRLWNKWGNTVHAIFYTRLLIQDCGYSRRVLPTTLVHKVTDCYTESAVSSVRFDPLYLLELRHVQ